MKNIALLMDPCSRTVEDQLGFEGFKRELKLEDEGDEGIADIGARKSSACTPPAATRPELRGRKHVQVNTGS